MARAAFLEGVKRLVDAVPVPVAAPLEGGAAEALQELPGESAEALEPPAPEVAPAAVAAYAGLRVSPLADGGLRIDAPPELALPLAGLLEALAQSLRAAQGGSPSAREAAQ